MQGAQKNEGRALEERPTRAFACALLSLIICAAIEDLKALARLTNATWKEIGLNRGI